MDPARLRIKPLIRLLRKHYPHVRTALEYENPLEILVATVLAAQCTEALKAKRWGFVVDVSKLTSDEDYQKCIDACHNIHNVPSHKEPRHEVK